MGVVGGLGRHRCCRRIGVLDIGMWDLGYGQHGYGFLGWTETDWDQNGFRMGPDRIWLAIRMAMMYRYL